MVFMYANLLLINKFNKKNRNFVFSTLEWKGAKRNSIHIMTMNRVLVTISYAQFVPIFMDHSTYCYFNFLITWDCFIIYSCFKSIVYFNSSHRCFNLLITSDSFIIYSCLNGLLLFLFFESYNKYFNL